MSVVKTIISVPTQGAAYTIPGDWTAARIREEYSDSIPNLANMTDSSSVATGPAGDERTVIFTPRTGNKG